MKKWVTLGFLAAFAVFSAMVKTDLRKNVSPLPQIRIGEPLKDLTFLNTAGEEVTLQQLSTGKRVVVLNFWASWCAPCRVEMPSFSKVYSDREKDGVLILGINEDEDRSNMETYLNERPVHFPILIDRESAAMKQLGVRALPTTIIVDGDGKVLQVQEGILEYLELLIDTHLKADSIRLQFP
jgi:peroxiredoxin